MGQEHASSCRCLRCFTPDWVLSSSSICSAPLRSRTAQWSGGDLFLFCFGIKRRPSGRCGVGCEPSQTVAVDKRTQREHFELHCSQLTSAALKSEASKIIVWSKWDSCIFVECGLPQCCTCCSHDAENLCHLVFVPCALSSCPCIYTHRTCVHLDSNLLIFSMFVEVAVFAALRALNHAGLGTWLTFALNLIAAVLRRDWYDW